MRNKKPRSNRASTPAGAKQHPLKHGRKEENSNSSSHSQQSNNSQELPHELSEILTSSNKDKSSPGRKKNKPARGQKKRSRKRTPQKTAIYAALDLGTNNCRLLVAKPTRRSFLVLDAFSRIIRLGEGVSKTGQLSQTAMDRTIEALKICSQKMERKGVQRSRLIATQACRLADNAGPFIERVSSETGLELEIIDQETEARLAVSGSSSLLDTNCDWALVFDIGGGSSELIWIDLKKLRDENPGYRMRNTFEVQKNIHCWTSLPIGVVTLAEKFENQCDSPDYFENMVEDVTQALEEFEKNCQMSVASSQGKIQLLGTSGTVTTLAGIHLKLPCYDRKKVDGCWLTSEAIREVSNDLMRMTFEQRVAQPCIGEDRADLVLAGSAILEALMRMWPSERVRVADRGLREGILTTLMTEDGAYRQRTRRTRNIYRRN